MERPFSLPAGSCDCHCHVFGPAATFPYAPERTYTPDDRPKEALAALHARLGIERGVIVQAGAHGVDHRALLDALATFGEGYRGTAIIDDRVSDEGLRELDAAGIRAARFNFVAHLGGGPEPELFDRTVARIAPLGWHILLHVDGPSLLGLAQRLETVAVPVVIDHMARVNALEGLAQPAFQTLLTLAERPNVWVKVSGVDRVSRAGPPYEDALPFAQALVERIPDRVLWGTDWPHPNHAGPIPDDVFLRDLIPRIAPDPVRRRRLLVDNPARLYGF